MRLTIRSITSQIDCSIVGSYDFSIINQMRRWRWQRSERTTDFVLNSKFTNEYRYEIIYSNRHTLMDTKPNTNINTHEEKFNASFIYIETVPKSSVQLMRIKCDLMLYSAFVWSNLNFPFSHTSMAHRFSFFRISDVRLLYDIIIDARNYLKLGTKSIDIVECSFFLVSSNKTKHA